MRQIKFRAKPCYMGGNQPAWVYGTFQYIAQRRVRQGATDNGTLEPRNDKGHIVDIYGTETEVLCDTVGQFTGLRDKNGKEIYEGDIINCGGCKPLLEVRFVRGVFYFLWSGDLDNEFPPVKSRPLYAEVVGNIHDNHELLSKSKQA